MTDNLSIVYFPAAVLLGALHALEPGHAKALTAAYLIGIKGTKRDSVLLGLSVAATHSLVVITVCAIGLWLGNEAFTGQATIWLERGSGLVAIAIGSWMLWRRLAPRHSAHHHHHHHAPEPVRLNGPSIQGTLQIIDTLEGERFEFTSTRPFLGETFEVRIDREDGRVETLSLKTDPHSPSRLMSERAPAEPHAFNAQLVATSSGETVDFSMSEPQGHDHGHDHSHMDDLAHAQAHANTMPEYVKSGWRPTKIQIMGFGAAGGMIPCPASITVMLLAISTGQTGLGVFTVLGFSLGLALALVGVGLLVVTGLSRLSGSGRLSWISQQAPVISAGLVIVSGAFALLIAS